MNDEPSPTPSAKEGQENTTSGETSPRPSAAEGKGERGTMKARTCRNVLLYVIIVFCFFFMYLRARFPDLKIPWDILLLFVIAMAAFSFLGRTEPGSVRHVDDVFEKAREKLIEWMQVQAVIVFLFVGITGFFIIQQAVQTAVQNSVDKELERTGDRYRKLLDDITLRATAAGTKADSVLERASSATSEVEQAAADATTLVAKTDSVLEQASSAASEVKQAAADTTTLVADEIRELNETFRSEEKRLKKRIDEFAVQLTQVLNESKKVTKAANEQITGLEEKLDAVGDQITEKGVALAAIVSKFDARFKVYAKRITDVQETSDEAILASSAGTNIDELSAVLEDPSASTAKKAAAIRALREKGPKAEGKIGLILDALGSGDKSIRVAAADAIGSIGRPADMCVPALKGVLENRDDAPEVLAAAARALMAFGAGARRAGAALVDLISHPDEDVAFAAAETVVRTRCQLDRAIPKICKQIENGRFRHLIWPMLELDGYAPLLNEPMRQILQNSQLSHDIRARAARVLAQNGDSIEEIVRLLWETRGTGDSAEYADALANCPDCKDLGEDVVDVLVSGFDIDISEKNYSLDPFAMALGRIGATEATGMLESLSELGVDASVRVGATLALAELRARKEQLLIFLSNTVAWDDGSFIHGGSLLNGALWRLGEIAREDNRAVRTVINLLDSIRLEDINAAYVIGRAIRALGKIGADSPDAKEVLERYRTECQWKHVRVYAAIALMDIDDRRKATEGLKPTEEGGRSDEATDGESERGSESGSDDEG